MDYVTAGPHEVTHQEQVVAPEIGDEYSLRPVAMKFGADGPHQFRYGFKVAVRRSAVGEV
jgi:hypothetical protein